MSPPCPPLSADLSRTCPSCAPGAGLAGQGHHSQVGLRPLLSNPFHYHCHGAHVDWSLGCHGCSKSSTIQNPEFRTSLTHTLSHSLSLSLSLTHTHTHIPRDMISSMWTRTEPKKTKSWQGLVARGCRCCLRRSSESTSTCRSMRLPRSLACAPPP